MLVIAHKFCTISKTLYTPSILPLIHILNKSKYRTGPYIAVILVILLVSGACPLHCGDFDECYIAVILVILLVSRA